MRGSALLIADAEPGATRLKEARFGNDRGHGSTFPTANEPLTRKQGLLILLICSVMFAANVFIGETDRNETEGERTTL